MGADRTPCFGHLVYGSPDLAANAAALHRMAYPHCEGIEPWSCDEHWHVGHATAGTGQRCKGHPEHRATRRRLDRVLGRRRPRRVRASRSP